MDLLSKIGVEVFSLWFLENSPNEWNHTQTHAVNEGDAVMGSVRQLASVTFKVRVLYRMLAS